MILVVRLVRFAVAVRGGRSHSWVSFVRTGAAFARLLGVTRSTENIPIGELELGIATNSSSAGRTLPIQQQYRSILHTTPDGLSLIHI